MDIQRFLADRGIAFELFRHPPVFTVEESERLVPPMPGVKTKNLFLRDRKGTRHILVTVPHDLSVGLDALGESLGAGRLGFASPERLMRHLGITPGSVSLLSLVHDGQRAVEFVIDRSLWEADAVQAHPLDNSATVVIPSLVVGQELCTGSDRVHGFRDGHAPPLSTGFGDRSGALTNMHLSRRPTQGGTTCRCREAEA